MKVSSLASSPAAMTPPAGEMTPGERQLVLPVASVSMAAAKWATGAEEWWTTCMVAVG